MALKWFLEVTQDITKTFFVLGCLRCFMIIFLWVMVKFKLQTRTIKDLLYVLNKKFYRFLVFIGVLCPNVVYCHTGYIFPLKLRVNCACFKCSRFLKYLQNKLFETALEMQSLNNLSFLSYSTLVTVCNYVQFTI